jgi:peptidoglycan-associated lipoprotein
MSRSWLAVGAGLAFAAACSHEQKREPTTPAQVSRPVAPPVRQVAAVPPPAAASSPVARTKAADAIFFDFDSSLVKDDARPVLQRVADSARNRNGSLEIDGNCDELGTVEYNLALGEHRARAAKEYLVRLGVPPGRVTTVSFGSQRPRYPGHNDEDRAKNRRDDLIVR